MHARHGKAAQFGAGLVHCHDLLGHIVGDVDELVVADHHIDGVRETIPDGLDRHVGDLAVVIDRHVDEAGVDLLAPESFTAAEDRKCSQEERAFIAQEFQSELLHWWLPFFACSVKT
jgi:hypothetical protein